jgi:hypothetical protein
MPRSYPPEAIDQCFQLYLRFNGQQHDRIENEMRRTWPGWSKQNLFNRGEKIGWIEKFGWELALKEKIALANSGQAVTEEQALFNEIAQVRKRLHDLIVTQGSKDRDVVYQHLAYCRLEINALAKLKGAGLTFDSFVAFWERLLDWLPDMSPEAASALLAVADELLDRARSEYGEQEADSNDTKL